MPTDIKTSNLDPASDAFSGAMVAVGLALRFAFVGVGAFVLGGMALFEGSMTPVNGVALAMGGAGVALASIAYLQRWARGLDAPAASAPGTAAPRLHRTSMHQPV